MSAPTFQQITAITVAYGLSLGAGWFAIAWFHTKMQLVLPIKPIHIGAQNEWLGRYSSHITGTLERLVFTTLMIAKPETALIGMGAWLGLKMAASWNKELDAIYPGYPKAKSRLITAGHAFLALQTGFASMALAGAAGGIARWIMCLPPV